MQPAELRQYLQFLLWHYRVVDGFWFLFTEEDRGRPEAEHRNEQVWERVSALAARELRSQFDIREAGLHGFVKMLRLYPWTILLGYEIQEAPDEVVVTVSKCATQEARRRRGLPEYECSEMHRREFVQLATTIDPRIEVLCDFAPPGRQPEEPDCRWRFTLGE